MAGEGGKDSHGEAGELSADRSVPGAVDGPAAERKFGKVR